MIETTILSNLIKNESYARKVLPFLKDEYFDQREYKVLFETIYNYVEKYNGLPTKEALRISVDDREDLNEQAYKNVNNIIDNLSTEDNDEEWLVDKTEKFCQDKAIFNAVRNSILILDGKDKTHDKGAIPNFLSDALSVAFDTNIGHDYLENSEDRYDYYHRKEHKIPFDIDFFNKITKGGVSRKALAILLAGTGVGKTMVMCHMAAANLMMGFNALYITAEMAEEEISKRIDANLLDLSLDDLVEIPRQTFDTRIEKVKKGTTGKLIVKEYPTGTPNANHFRFLLNELKMKKNFVPDIIYVDYLNICASVRYKRGSNAGSYDYIKSIAEELRGLAVEFGVPVFSATQTNRTGYTNSDVGLEDTSESFGLPATADFMVALISSEELEELGQLTVKQLKNRWGDINSPKRFVIGIDRNKMRLFDVEDSAQTLTDAPIMDSSAFNDIDDDFATVFKKSKGRVKPDLGGFLD